MEPRIAKVWRHAWQPQDRRPIYEWAADHVTVSPALAQSGGRFDVSMSRQFIRPMDALMDDTVRQLTVIAPVRSGKTLISDIWLPSIIARDNGPSMWVYQSDEIAKTNAKTRIKYHLDHCPPVQAKMPSNPDDAQTQFYKFADGVPLYIHGPGINKLQTKGIRYMCLDESWCYPAGTISEAKGRLGDFLKLRISKLLIISQGSTEEDETDSEFNSGDQAEWMVECQGPDCGKYFQPDWYGYRDDGSMWGMRWDRHKLDNGEWDVNKCLESIRYECPHCAHPHVDGNRLKEAWNATGKYESQNPSAPATRRSVHWNNVISAWWVDLVEEYLHAVNEHRVRGNPHPLIKFWQKQMAVPMSEFGLMTGGTQFPRSAYDIRSEWEDEAYRFMAIDRQAENVYWWMIRAWSNGGESRRISFGKAFSEADLEAARQEHGVKPYRVMIDSGKWSKGDSGVYDTCVRYGWIATKGVAEAGGTEKFFWHYLKDKKSGKMQRVQRSYAPLSYGDPERGKSANRGKKARLIRFSAPTMKDRVHQLIDAGKWIEPEVDQRNEWEKEYAVQMSSAFKKKITDKTTFREQWVWICPSGNDHLHDCAAIQCLAATLVGIFKE